MRLVSTLNYNTEKKRREKLQKERIKKGRTIDWFLLYSSLADSSGQPDDGLRSWLTEEN